MILLDGLDKREGQHPPKLVAEASSLPLARVHTPTPSLPDYEASQAQLRPTTQSYPEIQRKRNRRRRCRRFTIYALVAYFVLTVVIGIPILVIKLKRKAASKSNPYTSWDDTGSSLIPPKSITLGDAPLRLSAAKACNTWNVKNRPDGKMFVSELEYSIPVEDSVFLNTNITYASNASYLNQFSGSLSVVVNDDPSASDGFVHVTMHHTSIGVARATNVCLMDTSSGAGLYIFAPPNITSADALIFNITLTLPQNNTSPRYISQLMCHLPHFQHTYQQLDPRITLGTAIFGGAMSSVYVESVQAASVAVKASFAGIRGKFKVSSQLSLDTLSAPINADIHLYNDGSSQSPTYMHLTTGNNVLNANVSLYVPSTSDDGSSRGPHFLAHAETFNAPLNVAVSHENGSAPSAMRLRAINNLGTTQVTLDSKYAGTFDVNTMFAKADVLTWDGMDFDPQYDNGADDDDVDDKNPSVSSRDDSDGDDGDTYHKTGKLRLMLPSLTTTASSSEGTTTDAGRCLEFDVMSSSQILGWVGIPPRPLPSSMARDYGNMSHVEVISSLNSAQLFLLS